MALALRLDRPRARRRRGRRRNSLLFLNGRPLPLTARGVGRSERRHLRGLVLAFLVARLLAWAFLLPPWGGFDEAQHQGYVEACRERIFWPAYRSITLPDRLVQEVRRWPLPRRGPRPFPASALDSGEAGVSRAEPPGRTPIQNYETQQSPLYYVAAGRLLALLPDLTPVSELYLLRLLNVALALLVSWLAGQCAAALGFGPWSWLPAAFLAFLPGYGTALIRVTNDAFCALLLSLGLAAAVGFPRASDRSALAASLACGLAPWAKLYGWVGVPSVGAWALRRGSSRLQRAACALLLLAPGLLLAWGSWRLNGHPLPIQENLRPAGQPAMSEVPWLADAWGIAKTFVWVSGASSLVFPNGIYLVALLLVLGGVWLTVRSIRHEREKLILLVLPLVLFGFALAYHSARIHAAYGKGGGIGWYLWAAGLPLSLLATWGLGRSELAGRVLPPVLGFFLILTMMADAVQVLDTAGMVVATPKLHLLGIRPLALTELGRSFRASRPAAAGVAAIAFAAGSWLLGGAVVLRCRSRLTPRGS